MLLFPVFIADARDIVKIASAGYHEIGLDNENLYFKLGTIIN